MKRLAVILALLLLAGAVWADRQVITARQTSEAPMIDGDLSDACWKEAQPVSDFYFLNDGSSASEKTTAYVCFDAKNLYVAFDCMDSQPEKIVAEQKKRGGNIDGDDYVEFCLDPDNTQSYVVSFSATAAGVQDEYLHSGDITKTEWRGDWRAGAKRTPTGYAVEMSIPWDMLHYSANQSSMGVAFERNFPRKRQWWASPNLGPQWDKRLFYVMDGLKLPNTGSKPLIMPYVLTGTDDTPTTAGVDYKQAITPNITAVATINPDWRNVEQNVENVDFTYNERYLSESRPFFQEGKNWFPWDTLFYSRRIDEMDYGTKVFGRVGDYVVSEMHGSCPGGNDFDVFRIYQTWSTDARMTIAGTSSRWAGDNDFAFGASAYKNIKERGVNIVEAGVSYFSSDAMDGSGFGRKWGWSISANNGPRVVKWGINHDQVDEKFQPRLGYVPERDFTKYVAWMSMYDRPAAGPFSKWNVGCQAETADHISDGTLYYNKYSFYGTWDCRNGTGLGLGGYTRERPPYSENLAYVFYDWNVLDLYRRGGVEIDIGKQAGGDYLYTSLYQGWKLNDKFSTQLSFEHGEIKVPNPEAYSANQLVDTLTYEISPERTLTGRVVLVGGNTNSYFSYRQRTSNGMDVFLIFGDPNALATKNVFALKLIYPIR